MLLTYCAAPPELSVRAWQVPHYFLPFDSPISPNTPSTMAQQFVSPHMINLNPLTSSQWYLLICDGGNVSCQYIVSGKVRGSKRENKRVSERKRR